MAQVIQQAPAHIAKTGITGQHQRATTGAAATLGSLVTIPTLPGNVVGTTKYPSIVTLQVEAGQANAVYYTLDGSTPSATNGIQLPAGPYREALPYPDLIANTGTVSATNQQIQLFSPGATFVQCLFEWF